MTYEVVMTNGDRAEAGSVSAMLRCVEQLHEDSGGTSRVQGIYTSIIGFPFADEAFTRTAKQHLEEVTHR